METCALFFDVSVQARKIQPPLWKEIAQLAERCLIAEVVVFIESSSKVMYVDTREYIRMLRRHAVLTGTRLHWCGREESCVLLATAMSFS